ncbi:hypothetical protein DNU06_09200 [Putridiphycobacter roseus]|uniref:Secretion system C-terminal sorting domain-containing protein n=1 Tax=Putridiphycobacter roseus TaxID=2219161 RepID=A0A2W1MZT8_9FLAO|nr:T9SS type A sorting domain-containing protein [Putridiphycobacter roseus]PZE16924.1 hypothetical protein DNU06_09200 [Putridiphycobacter roseus]
MKTSLLFTLLFFKFILYAQCSFTYTTVTPSCGSQCDGKITITVNGVGPFTATVDGVLMNQVGTSNSFEVDNLCGGDYIVEIVDATNCTSVDTITVEPWLPIQINLSVTQTTSSPTACDGKIYCLIIDQFSINSTLANWYNCDDSTEVSVSIIGNSSTGFCAGNYYARILNDFGCTRAYSDCISIGTLSIEESKDKEIQVFVKNGGLHVSIDYANLTVYDLNGKQVFYTNSENNSIADLPLGLYILKINSTDDKYYTIKFVKD